MKTAPTVHRARELLARASRRPMVKTMCRLPVAVAIKIIREALRGRLPDDPISTWLAEVVSFISCRHMGACMQDETCAACGCFLCERPST